MTAYCVYLSWSILVCTWWLKPPVEDILIGKICLVMNWNQEKMVYGLSHSAFEDKCSWRLELIQPEFQRR